MALTYSDLFAARLQGVYNHSDSFVWLLNTPFPSDADAALTSLTAANVLVAGYDNTSTPVSLPLAANYVADGMGGYLQPTGGQVVAPASLVLRSGTVGCACVTMYKIGSAGAWYPASSVMFVSVGLRGSGAEMELDSLSVTAGVAKTIYVNPWAVR